MRIKISVKHLSLLIGVLSLLSFKKVNIEKVQFNKYFETSTLRVDYYLTGNANGETFVLQQLKKTIHWAGKENLITKDTLNLGNFRFNVIDSATNKLLYTKGFNSLFEEWQTTDEATQIQKSFYHVNLMPFPRQTIIYQLQKRNKETGTFEDIHKEIINPTNYFIINEKPSPHKVTTIHGNNHASKKIDIAFLAEGYKKNEMGKFKKDVKRVWEYFMDIPPFNQYKNRFNVYAVQSVSQESGVDIPGEYIYRNTALNFTFYTFDIERYLTSIDLKAMHDAAEVVPYDQIFILINSDKYGGGGFLNYYSAGTADNELSLKVAIHEFGHGFAGLADEYYSSSVAYNDYYNLNLEPWEPNITTLVNFQTKWADMVDSNTPIPTKREPAHNYDIGVYEGGGYSAKGIYSPYQNCRMKSNTPRGFCPVCSRAIVRVINHLSEE